MLAYGLEYCDVDLRISGEQVQQFLQELELRKMSYSIEESQQDYIVSIHHRENHYTLMFRKLGEYYKLRSKNLRISDEKLADVFQKTLTSSKGHAIMKLIRSDSLLIHNIQFGEAVRITEISGDKRKVLLDKEGTVTIQQVIEAFKRKDTEKRIPELRAEIDTELVRLSSLLKKGSEEKIAACLTRLEVLRKEMMLLEL